MSPLATRPTSQRATPEALGPLMSRADGQNRAIGLTMLEVHRTMRQGAS